MSGLGNVLGNVYGNDDDQPQKRDLSDVQESMDALVDAAQPEDDEVEAFFDEPDASSLDDSGFDDTAFDETAVFDDTSFGEDPVLDDDSAADGSFGPDDDIFDTGGLTFLDEDDESSFDDDTPPETIDASPSVDEVAEADNEAIDEAPTLDDLKAESDDDAAPEALGDASWLDALDGGSDASDDWMSALPDDTADVDDPAEGFQAAIDAVPDLDDPPEVDAELEQQDEQWLDDLFSNDGQAPTDTEPSIDTESSIDTEPSIDEAPAAHTDEELVESTHEAVDADEAVEQPAFVADTSEEIAPHDHDAAAPHAVEPEPYAEDAADIAELAIGADAKAPSLEEVQEVTAAAASSESVTQVAYVGADWIRSDDDIIPMKGKTLRAMKKSRKDEPLLQPIAVGEDPIALFSPMEEPAEKKSKRGRLSRKKRAEELDAEIAQLNLDAQAGLGVEELIAGTVTTDEAAEPVLEPVDDDHTDHIDVSVTDADAAVTADAAITSDTSSDDTEDGDETTDVLVPPRIEDAGLPELPDLPEGATFFDHGDTEATNSEDAPIDGDASAETDDEETDTSTDEPEKKRRLRLRRK